LQFGNPENEQIFWTFLESIRAIKDFCEYLKIPVVGGKVSLYNETKNGPIKPSPVIGTLGIIENKKIIRLDMPQISDSIFIIGMTYDEIGGSEYYEHFHKIIGGKVPVVNLINHSKICKSIRIMLDLKWISAVHDCSKGGIITSLLEISIQSNLGFVMDVERIPTTCERLDYVLFSETHSRFIISTKYSSKVKEYLIKEKISFAEIGTLTREKKCVIRKNNKIISNLFLSSIIKKYEDTISNILEKNIKES
jgi:phosphoribosylformylglycinamidine synthase subunit PurL